MSERYLITGVQLGMLKVLPKKEVGNLIDEIVEKQFVGHSTTNKGIEYDSKEISKLFKQTR